MKRLAFLSLGLAAMVMMNSCGGGSSTTSENGLYDKAIQSAEEAVPIVNNPVVGDLVSLNQQSLSAGDSLYAFYNREKRNLGENASDEEIGKLHENYVSAKEKIEKYYKDKMSAEEEKLVGQEVPVEFNKEQYSSVKACITKFERTEVYFEITMTLAAPLKNIKDGKPVANWAILGEDGSVLRKSDEMGHPFGLDSKVTISDNVAGAEGTLMAFTSISILKGATTLMFY